MFAFHSKAKAKNMLEMFTDADPMRSDDYALPADGWRENKTAHRAQEGKVDIEQKEFLDELRKSNIKLVRRAICHINSLNAEISELRSAKDGVLDNLSAVTNERDRLRAKLAAMESQEPVGKVVKSLNSNTAICSGEGFAAAAIYSDIFLKPVPADKPPRITEQDAREIIQSYKNWRENREIGNLITPERWLEDEGHTLLNKLNADREQVPAVVVPDSLISDIEFVCNAIHNETAMQVCCGRPGQECCGSPDVDWPSWATEAMTKLSSVRDSLIEAAPSHSQQSEPAVAVPEKSYFALADELFELGGDAPVGEAPNLSEIYAILDKHLVTTPSHSQQSSETDAERFCDSHCTWRDHHPDCPSHESEHPKILPIPVVTGSKGLQAGITDTGGILCRIDAGIADHE